MENPTIPLGYDIAWAALMLLWLGLVVCAWVSVARSDVDRAGKLGWGLLILALPVLGSALWFYSSRKRQVRG